jgi:hypothetical protein
LIEGYSTESSYLLSVLPENPLYSWAANTYEALMKCVQ